jgi:hypothetical protein
VEQHETSFTHQGGSIVLITPVTIKTFIMTSSKGSVEEDGGGALLAVKLSRLTARLDELQEQNGALIADKESLAAQVAALQQVSVAVSSMHGRQSYKTAEIALQCC